MYRRFLGPSFVFLIASLSILFASVAAVQEPLRAPTFPSHNSRQQHTLSQTHQGGHAFPWLRWLRDSAVEIVFGRPSNSKDASDGSLKSYKRYANDIVIRFNVTEEEQETALAEAANRLFLDVWASTPDYVDIRLHKEDLSSLFTLLPPSLESSYATIIPNLGKVAHATYPSKPFDRDRFEASRLDPATILPSQNGIDNIFFSDYQPLPVISRWMRLLEAMFPAYVEMLSVGTSYEERDIPALRVGERRFDDTAPRRTIVVTGGLHAREWVSTSTVTYLIWSFITEFGKDVRVTKFLQQYDIIFIPVLNPDGYEYTWQFDRLWRKSRQQTGLRFCRGVDLDHAFGFGWDGAKYHADPCSESYGGNQPFQAVEASQLAEWAKNMTRSGAVKFEGLFDLHSYSQQILFPFAFSCSASPPNLENLQEGAFALARAIRRSGGEFYSVASACEGAVVRTNQSGDDEKIVHTRVESGGGSAVDWFYHEMHAPFSYQIKLRDTGSYGFLLPRTEIIPTGEEMFYALKDFGDWLQGNRGIEKSTTIQEAKPAAEPEKAGEENIPAEAEDPAGFELRRRRRR